MYESKENAADDYEHYHVEEYEHQSPVGAIAMYRVLDSKGRVVSFGLEIDRAEVLAEYLNEEAAIRQSERTYLDMFGGSP